MKVKCGNCGWEGEFGETAPARHITERHAMGGLYSNRECPAKGCGALVFPVDRHERYPWPPRPDAPADERYRYALGLLRQARDLLDGAPRAQKRVRLALTSTDGAVRHAESQAAGERRHG